MPIIIHDDLYRTKDTILRYRIQHAQVIEKLLEEFETIAVKIAKEEATDSDIARQDDIANIYLKRATNAFRLHLEGSGSCVRAYNSVHDRTIQTIALDMLRTIQMVKPMKATK